MEDLTPLKAIKFAVNTEEIGARFYTRMAKKFSDKDEVKEVFTKLARDEEIHRKQFQALVEQTPVTDVDKMAYEQGQYLRAMAISQFFSQSSGPFRNTDKIEEPVDALQRAFEFEKATLGFYLAIQDVVGESPTLEKVIEAEKGHIIALMKVLMTDAEFRSLQDRW